MYKYPDHVAELIEHSRFGACTGPWCCFLIDLQRLSPRQLRDRKEMIRYKGTNLPECSYPAQVMLDGKPYCRNHAGEVLLRELVGPSPPKGWRR